MKKFVLTVACFVLGAFAAFAVERGPLLVPDYNRDGVIDEIDGDRLAKGEAFTVWINDDDDADGTNEGANAGDTNSDLHDVPGGEGNDRDCEDDTVNGRCDLLDFFPVLVDVPDSEDLRNLSWKLCGAGVNVVFTPLTANTAGDFHTKAVRAMDGQTPLYQAAVTALTEDGVELPEGFLESGKGVFVFEGSATNDVEMKLCGFNGDGECVCSNRLNLAVRNVEEMYGWMNLREKGTGNREEGTGEERSAPRREDASGTVLDNRHFILVHGYNSNHEESRGNAAEFYKKLWQSGSDAMFTAVEWKGDQSQIDLSSFGITVTPNYFVNVENAFAAAHPFAEACKNLPGEKILVGHSLGNMLISSAIKDYGLDYTKYVMLNAAVAREAFNASAYDKDMVDEDWLDVDEVEKVGGDELTNHLDRASRWYRNFADKKYDPYEYRRKLAWRGRFANLPRTINYYSPTDNVLLNPDPNEKDPDKYDKEEVFLEYQKRLGVSAPGNPKTGFGFWAFSEKMKGTWVVDAINEVLTNTFEMEETDAMKCEAGWGENENYEAGKPFDPANTRFTPFLDERMKTQGMLDILPAETERVRAQHLADAIPAESFAAGANEVATLENVNMESFIDDTTGHWPVYEGGDTTPDGRTNEWRHSTFREVAFYHTSKLYTSLAAVGKPRIIIDANVDGGKDTLFTIDLAERMIAADKLDLLAVMTNGVDEAMARYQELLGIASEKSVVICAIGSADTLAALLASHAELVEKTVKELRVVDEATVPQGWPTKVVVTEARPAFYESKDILADFPAGTLSPAIRAAETNDPSGVQLVGPMAVLPLTEGEPITNQTAAAILNRLRAIYRTGNPALPEAVRCIKDAGVDYNGHDLTFKVPKFSLGAYSPNDVHMVFAFDDKSYEPDEVTYDPVLEVFSVHFTVPKEDATARNFYNGKLTITLENEKLGPTVIKEVPTQIVQGVIERGASTEWFDETNLEVPTNYVPSEVGCGAMPERRTANVETTFRFEEPSPATYDPPEGEVQAAVRVVEDGLGGYKFQYYAFAGLDDGKYYRTWHDFNVGGEKVHEIKPEIGQTYIVRMEGFYEEDARGEANTLSFSVMQEGSNEGFVPQFVGNIVNKNGGIGGTTRLNAVEFAGEGEVFELKGEYCQNVVNANLAKIDYEAEYATVAEAVAAADGEPIRLLHAASWKPTMDDIGKPVAFLNKSQLVLDDSELPFGMRPVWSNVDGNDGTLTLKQLYGEPKKIVPYLHEIWYEGYVDSPLTGEDAPFGDLPVKGLGGCSSVRVGNFHGRNLDLGISDTASIVVHMAASSNRFASVGTTQWGDVSETALNAGAVSVFRFDVLPNWMVDGINENGVAINVNVVPVDVPQDGENPESDTRPALHARKVVRYVLDHAESAAGVIEDLKKFRIYGNIGTGTYYLHWMISDAEKTFVVEIINGEVVAREHPIMTNFNLNWDNKNKRAILPEEFENWGPEKYFNPAIYSNNTDKILEVYTPHGDGIERYRTLRDAPYTEKGATFEGMFELMRSARYSRVADLPLEKTFRSDLAEIGEVKDAGLGDIVKIFASENFGMLQTVWKTLQPAMTNTYAHLAEHRKPGELGEYSITTHNVTFDLKRKMFRIVVQEDYDRMFNIWLVDSPEGSKENPWEIGATENDTVIAYTNGTGRLEIDGKGTMKNFDPSAPWAGGTVTECLVGSNVTVIGAKCFADCAALKTLVLYEQTPPTLGAGNDLASVKIFVAAGAADAYRATWSAFAEQIDEMRSVKGEKIATHLYEMTYRWWDATRANDIAEDLAEFVETIDWLMELYRRFFPYQFFDWYEDMAKRALCTSCRNGNFVGRNFDWGYDDVDECVMHVPAAEGRLESVGVASWFFPKWMQDLFNVDEFLPELTMDGVNEKGVAINVNVVPGGDNGWTVGTNSNATRRLCAGFAVRTVLDNATNAAHAVEILQSRDIYSLKPLEFHWMISDATESYIVECVSNALVVLKAHDARPKMSNYYVSHSPSVAEYDVLTNAELTAGFHTPHAMGIERYANVSNGLEQVNSAEAMFTHMTNVWYKPKYLPGNERKYWSDLNGAPIPEEYAQAKGDRFEFNDGLDKARSNAFKRIQANYVAVTNYEAKYNSRTIDHSKEEWRWLTNGVVHTVHTSIYDLERRELVVCVQEDVGTIKLRYPDEPYAPVPVTPGSPVTYDSKAMAEKAAGRAVFTPSAEVADKLGKGSPELGRYCDMFGFAVVPAAGGQWSVEAALYHEDWTNVVESAQAATLQIPVADLAAWRSGDDPIPVQLTNCVPGFFYSLYDGAAVTNIKADLREGNINVLCGKEKTVDLPEVTPPPGCTTSGFFSIGVLEVPDVLKGAETYHTITGFQANTPSHH